MLQVTVAIITLRRNPVTLTLQSTSIIHFMLKVGFFSVLWFLAHVQTTSSLGSYADVSAD